MEVIERVLKIIKKGNTNAVSKEGKSISEAWDYNRFREYLLSLAKGENSLLSIDQYPKAIVLSEDWHSLLNQMREDSVDGIERWALIGFKEDRRAMYLPTVAAKGLSDYVPAEVMLESRNRARTKAGITSLLGDIHSHPRVLRKENWGKFFRKPPKLFEVGSTGTSFSAGDLYFMVLPRHHNLVKGLVTGNENLFAFRTRESTDLGIDPNFLSQDTFEKYWYEENGFKYLGSVKEFGANRIKQVRPDANTWSVNLGIAERHKLVLYRGISGQNLVKVSSPSK